MLKAIIADDERLALEELCYQLRRYEDIRIEGAYTNPVEALGQIILKQPDIVFLDMDMPIMSGMNLAREIAGMAGNTDIVFVTAFSEYAVSAFEVNAVDYVLKPVSPGRLDRTLERIHERRRGGAGTSRGILEKLDSFDRFIRRQEEKFAVWSEGEILLLKASDILRITAGKGAVSVISEQGTYTGRGGIDQWEDRLKEYNFFRCHRCELVNMDYVEKIIPYENTCCTIVLKNDRNEIPVSRSRTKELKRMLNI